MQVEALRQSILAQDSNQLEALTLEVFYYQAKNCAVYRTYLQHLGLSIEGIHSIKQIPFLPISLFKKQGVKTGNWTPVKVFRSSRTTGTSPSEHLVRDLSYYERISLRNFESFFPPTNSLAFLALVPSYLERKDASLIFMLRHFIQKSKYPQSGFYLDDWEGLKNVLQECMEHQIPTQLWGVTFALLDFAEKNALPLPDHIRIIETGGMKGRRKEMIREEVHARLKNYFSTSLVGSEYGMTELFSQAYAIEGNKFHPGPTMRVFHRQLNDPFSWEQAGKIGVLNIIDLGNIDTCSFIETEDIGKVYADGTFEVLGRLQGSDVRGCNLMIGGL